MQLIPILVPTVNVATEQMNRVMGSPKQATPVTLFSVLGPPREAKDRGLLRHIVFTVIVQSTSDEQRMLLEQQLVIMHSDVDLGTIATGSLDDWIDMMIRLSQYQESRMVATVIYNMLMAVGMSPFLEKLQRRGSGLPTMYWGCI